MTLSPHPYMSRHLAVLVPTKDRPQKMRELLTSLAAQTAPVGRIIIVDGGASVRDVVMEFADRLPVEHHLCQPPGQIRQRNLGISLLHDRTPLVASLDDDIVLESDAVASMIAFWNRAEPETAGVSFNIINGPSEQRSWIRERFFVTAGVPGRVLPSGLTSSNCAVITDVRAQWLCGGATVWKLDILRGSTHREIQAKWAIAEDAIFSYPIGKRFPLYVCAAARVRHEHVFDYRVKTPHRFHGYTQTTWVFYFVRNNPDLSSAAFFWMVVGTALGRVLGGVLMRDTGRLQFAVGQLHGAARAGWSLVTGQDPASVVTERPRRGTATS
jgi:glycosyltransferase involved in cell wall biosynthesis